MNVATRVASQIAHAVTGKHDKTQAGAKSGASFSDALSLGTPAAHHRAGQQTAERPAHADQPRLTTTPKQETPSSAGASATTEDNESDSDTQKSRETDFAVNQQLWLAANVKQDEPRKTAVAGSDVTADERSAQSSEPGTPESTNSARSASLQATAVATDEETPGNQLRSEKAVSSSKATQNIETGDEPTQRSTASDKRPNVQPTREAAPTTAPQSTLRTVDIEPQAAHEAQPRTQTKPALLRENLSNTKPSEGKPGGAVETPVNEQPSTNATNSTAAAPETTEHPYSGSGASASETSVSTTSSGSDFRTTAAIPRIEPAHASSPSPEQTPTLQGQSPASISQPDVPIAVPGSQPVSILSVETSPSPAKQETTAGQVEAARTQPVRADPGSTVAAEGSADLRTPVVEPIQFDTTDLTKVSLTANAPGPRANTTAGGESDRSPVEPTANAGSRVATTTVTPTAQAEPATEPVAATRSEPTSDDNRTGEQTASKDTPMVRTPHVADESASQAMVASRPTQTPTTVEKPAKVRIRETMVPHVAPNIESTPSRVRPETSPTVEPTEGTDVHNVVTRTVPMPLIEIEPTPAQRPAAVVTPNIESTPARVRPETPPTVEPTEGTDVNNVVARTDPTPSIEIEQMPAQRPATMVVPSATQVAIAAVPAIATLPLNFNSKISAAVEIGQKPVLLRAARDIASIISGARLDASFREADRTSAVLKEANKAKAAEKSPDPAATPTPAVPTTAVAANTLPAIDEPAGAVAGVAPSPGGQADADTPRADIRVPERMEIAPAKTAVQTVAMPSNTVTSTVVESISQAASATQAPANISNPHLPGHRADSSAPHQLTIQLHPGELGVVTAVLRKSGDQLSVELSVEKSEAYQRLSADSDTIIKALRGLGLQVDQITIQQPQIATQGAVKADGSFTPQTSPGRDQQFAQTGNQNGNGNGQSGGRSNGDGQNGSQQRSPIDTNRQSAGNSGIYI